jgi:Zn-dependent M28 family amino/carboxypeptidase
MYETIKYLTQINPPRNHKNITTLNQVADYIKHRFEAIGLEVAFQEFEVDDKIYKNVIATLNSNFEKRLIVGGHYDVCGDIQGADDNASAIAGIIESATQLYKYKDQLNFRVDFVAFTLEEPPYFGTENMGSYKHVQYLKDNKIDVIGMINYEMIGYFTNEPNSQDYPIESMKLIYPTTGNFIAIVSNETSSSFLVNLNIDNIKKKIDSVNIVLPKYLEEITMSDNLNYWYFGFDAIMITDTAFFRNKNYHTVNDTLDTLDFEKMQYSIDMIVKSITTLNARA